MLFDDLSHITIVEEEVLNSLAGVNVTMMASLNYAQLCCHTFCPCAVSWIPNWQSHATHEQRLRNICAKLRYETFATNLAYLKIDSSLVTIPRGDSILTSGRDPSGLEHRLRGRAGPLILRLNVELRQTKATAAAISLYFNSTSSPKKSDRFTGNVASKTVEASKIAEASQTLDFHPSLGPN